MSSILVTLATFFAVCSALPAYKTELLPYSQDPFFDPPVDFRTAQPGKILRMREAPGNLTSIYNTSSIAYHVIYRTTNSRYEPSRAVTTLFVPHSPGKELLSYQIPYNTADPSAGPSSALYSEYASGLVQSDIKTALNNGWYVNVPDFEGPTASFTSGVQEGHAVLDSIRAVLSQHDIDRYAMWGYSGGSIASEWAAELQVQYAPELNISGMAIGGVIPNLTNCLARIDKTPASGLIPAVLVGTVNQYPESFDLLVSSLKPETKIEFLSTQNMSYFEAASTFGRQNILNDYFVDGASFLASIKDIIDSNGIMGYHGVPQMPIFIYKAIHDEYSSIADLDELVDRYCGIGADILYQRNENGNHLDEYTNGDERALQWLKEILNGSNTENSGKGCTVQNVNVNITSHGPFAPP